jgi:hypothetical protein
MHRDPGFPEAALRLALDPATDAELRRASLAGLVVFAREDAGSRSPRLTEWITRLRALESSPQRALRAGASDAISSLERLARQRM